MKRIFHNTFQERDIDLHKLYQNRELIVFLEGEKYFDQQVRNIWEAWFRYEMCKPDLMDIEISIICWLDDHGYLKE